MPRSSFLRVCTLASGSSGNSIYVECPAGAVLVDAGISGRRIAAAVRQVGGSLDRVGAVVVTHSHIDHTRGAGVVARRLGVPALMTQGTYDTGQAAVGLRDRAVLLRRGEPAELGGFAIHHVPTPHDARGSAAVVVEHQRYRVGILTDLGHCFAALGPLLATLDVAILEANYDPAMLASGPYPAHLKRRIASPRGHLSNAEAAGLLAEHGTPRLRAVLLAHLSENNNTAELALAAVRRLAGAGLAAHGTELAVAPRHAPSAMIELSPPRSPPERR